MPKPDLVISTEPNVVEDDTDLQFRMPKSSKQRSPAKF